VVLRPAKLWNDTTSATQAARLVSGLGREHWVRRTGLVPTAAITISKLAWLAEKEPASFERLRLALLPHDWLTMQLTGEAVTDRGDASGTGYFDPVGNVWCLDLLNCIDPERDWLAQLPRVLGPQTAAGQANTARAAALGLRPGTLVGPGTGDQSAAALGLNIQEGDVFVSLGTSGVVAGISMRQVIDALGRVNGSASASGGFQPTIVTLNAAKVTDTFARLLGVDHSGMSRLALAADRSDASRPMLVPYLDGERTPDRPFARGLLMDLSSVCTREALALCAFEGVAFGLLQGRDTLIEAGLRADGRFILAGGASRSPAYQRSFAELSGMPVRVADVDGGVISARGAAVQAAAVLVGATAREVALAWAPDCGVVAEPLPGDADYAEERRVRYRAAVAIQQPDEVLLPQMSTH
jgi:xylulokinase